MQPLSDPAAAGESTAGICYGAAGYGGGAVLLGGDGAAGDLGASLGGELPGDYGGQRGEHGDGLAGLGGAVPAGNSGPSAGGAAGSGADLSAQGMEGAGGALPASHRDGGHDLRRRRAGESGALREVLLLAESPLRGVALGAATTAVLQSSGAAIGILQALCAAGQLRGGAVGPILMGQNIGTCATALLASLAGGREARAVALAHLGFNLVGTAVCLPVWLLVQGQFAAMMPLGIALVHTGFNLLTCGVFWAAGAAGRKSEVRN